MLRKKPQDSIKINSFLERSATAMEDKEEKLKDSTIHAHWPLTPLKNKLVHEEGSKLRKPISLPLKEFEWNTIDKHTKKLNVGKSEWIRHAINKLLEEEQGLICHDKQ